MNAKKIGFIGLGLIGGSIAKAIRQYYPDYDIIAFDKNKESLALAIQEGTIHTSCSSIDDNFRGCNYIFLCAPVTYNAAYLSQLKDLLDENCILTDVGILKTSIHEEVIRKIIDYADSIGFEVLHLEYSPIKGPEGNIEYLLYLQNHPELADEIGVEIDPKTIVEEAHNTL